MKLVIDCRMLDSGGIGSFLSELIPFLIKEHDCLLIGNEIKLESYKNYKNVKILNCNIKPFSLTELLHFPKELLTIINTYDNYFTPYCNIPSGIKIPIYSTIHDIVFLDIPNITSFIGVKVRKFFYQRAINKSKKIFTVSKFSKKRIQKKLNCKNKDIIVVYNSAPSYLQTKSEINSKIEDIILFIGNIKKHKGLSTLLDAYEIAKKNGLTSKLTIVGNSKNFRTGDKNIIKKIQQEELKGNIVFTGKISNEELKNLYSISKYIVQPSFYEGFGIPPLEAMFMGTPALISDIEVFKEIYHDFPVTFFRVGDPEDLAKKMILMDTARINLGKLCDYYSYENSAQIINRAIYGLI